MNDFLNDFESLFGIQNENKRDHSAELKKAEENLNNKKLIHIRLDRDILEFFQSGGSGYQTRINDALREYMDLKNADSERRRVRKRSAVSIIGPDV